MLALARAVAVQPKLIIADEMSLGLAPQIVQAVFDSLEEIRGSGVTIVLSEQFVHRALSFADSCVILSRGRIGWSGRASDAGPEVIDHYLGDGEEMLADNKWIRRRTIRTLLNASPMSRPNVAVVVGGGSGIGAAVLAEYQARGVTPMVWDIAGDYDVFCDISSPESVEAALSESMERVGVPDQLTITAGVGHGALLLDESVEAFDRIIAINTRGPWLVTRAVARELIASGVAGSMVVISSASAHVVDRAMGTYCASKSALSMLVKVAASEWAQ